MNTIHNQSSNEDLLCCRVCLMTDCRLFNVHQYELSEAFSRISGTPVYKDQLPQYLCMYCSTLLLKCTSFRDMCLRTEQCLKLELLKGELTTDHIRRIDRPSQRLNLTLTVVQIVDCMEANPADIKNEPDDVTDIDEPTIDTDIKGEVYIDTDEPIIDICTKSEVNIDTDEGNLCESNIDDKDEDNLGESNINEANEDTVDIDCGIQNDDTETELVDINERVKINIHNEVEGILVNKLKTVKTYKRNITTLVRKKMETETQVYGDKVHEKIDKDRAEIDLDTASNDKTEINISYTDLDYANVNEGGYVSGTNAIDEVEAHMDIVDVDITIKEAVKKRKTCTRKIGTTAKSKDNCDDADTLERPVKRGRPLKEKKLKFRSPANDNMPVFDFAKFESDCAVRIVTLSKQEQLEEIALRKQSTNYTASRFRCEECGKGYDVEAAYNNHRRRHSPGSGEHACEICSMRFKWSCLRYQHQDTHRLKFVCKECGFVTRNRDGARRHRDVHKGRSYDCQYCGKQFIKRSTYLSHVRLAHPTMNVVCGDCGETFVSEMGLRMHRARMHPENIFKCTTCSATFVNLDALETHTATGEHSGNPCKQCGESCASEEALQAHVGERHPTESHRCEECAALLRYHQSSHLAVKPFPCSQCPKTFITNGVRNAHERCHKGERPFKCPDCPQAYTTRANFKRHHNAVHLGVHDNATCHACGHVFTAKAALRTHIKRVHNGQPWPKRDRKRKKVASH